MHVPAHRITENVNRVYARFFLVEPVEPLNQLSALPPQAFMEYPPVPLDLNPKHPPIEFLQQGWHIKTWLAQKCVW